MSLNTSSQGGRTGWVGEAATTQAESSKSRLHFLNPDHQAEPRGNPWYALHWRQSCTLMKQLHATTEEFTRPRDHTWLGWNPNAIEDWHREGND